MKNKTNFLEKTFVVASIMNTKSKYFNERFITLEECNIITQQIRKKFNETQTDIIITDKINREYFEVIGEVITSKVELEDIKEISLINNYIIKIMFDENFIYNCLCDITLSKLINSIGRSCINCNTHCSGGPEGYFCDRWSNDTMISFKKILKR